MKLRNRYGVLFAAAMVVFAVGAAVATVAESISDVVHQISLTSSSSYVEQGVGLYNLNATDSSVRYGIFMTGVTDGILPTNGLAAVAAQGSPKPLSGSAPSASATFYVQNSDTARTTISLSFSSATAASGSWSGTLSGGSGTAMDTFRTGSFFSADSGLLRFGDSVVSANYLASQSMNSDGEADTAASTTTNVTIAVTWDSLVAAGDSVRLIVINAAGKVAGDSNMSRLTATDTTWVSSTVALETGVTKFIVIAWDASRSAYVLQTGSLSLGATTSTIAATGGTVTSVTGSTAVGTISRIDVTAGVTTPVINTIQIVDLANDGAAKADGFANVDTNTSGFDTRLQNTAFSINLFDVNGNPIKSLASGQTVLVVVQYNFGNLTASQASSIRLLHRNATTNSWDVVSNSTPDSTNGRLVAYVSSFSDFALGIVNTTAAAAAADDDDCAITVVAGKTGLQGILPSLRSVRDTLLGSAFGRLFVSGYYAFGMMMLAAAGFGVALASRR